jgi:hypothetical protein
MKLLGAKSIKTNFQKLGLKFGNHLQFKCDLELNTF